MDNPVLNERFTDRNAETLGKELAKHNIFNAQHTICLKDGSTIIHSLDEWNTIVSEQLDKLYSTPELSTVFQKLKNLLTKNTEASRLRDIIVANREIIPYFNNIGDFKKQVWLDCFSKLDLPFEQYYSRISQYTEQIRGLYEQAAAQSQRWQTIVTEFNRRFRVPFEVQIENKANFLLKDEAPNLSFKYTRGLTEQQTAMLKKDDLMLSLKLIDDMMPEILDRAVEVYRQAKNVKCESAYLASCIFRTLINYDAYIERLFRQTFYN